MSPEQITEVLQLCEASAADNGFRELPQKTTLSFYCARQGVGLTVSSVEAVALRGAAVHARTNKGDLYVFAIDDVFAVNIEGKMVPKGPRRAGFGA